MCKHCLCHLSWAFFFDVCFSWVREYTLSLCDSLVQLNSQGPSFLIFVIFRGVLVKFLLAFGVFVQLAKTLWGIIFDRHFYFQNWCAQIVDFY
jgi:hypothetical protein